MNDLTPELSRILGGAARYVSHRACISTAAAAEQLKRHPEMLTDLARELATLADALEHTQPGKDAE